MRILMMLLYVQKCLLSMISTISMVSKSQVLHQTSGAPPPMSYLIMGVPLQISVLTFMMFEMPGVSPLSSETAQPIDRNLKGRCRPWGAHFFDQNSYCKMFTFFLLICAPCKFSFHVITKCSCFTKKYSFIFLQL